MRVSAILHRESTDSLIKSIQSSNLTPKPYSLYYDDIEVANPLGSKAGVHKTSSFSIHTFGELAYAIHSLKAQRYITM